MELTIDILAAIEGGDSESPGLSLVELFRRAASAGVGLLFAKQARAGNQGKSKGQGKKSSPSGAVKKKGRSPARMEEPAEDPEDGPEDEDPEEPEDEEVEDVEDDEIVDEAEGETGDEGTEEGKVSTRRVGSGREDLDLIEEFLSGDRQAFNRLVLKYQNKVNNLCYRVIGDKDEAEDMAQEIFITVHNSLGNFRGESLFSTWLYRISVNHCKNRIKYLGRRKYYHSVSLDQPRETDDGGDLYQEVEDESPSPESEMRTQEVQVLVQDAIAKLDADHRLVIVLRDIEDFSYEEISDMVGIKVGTVKSRIHRARNELKAMLEGKVSI